MDGGVRLAVVVHSSHQAIRVGLLGLEIQRGPSSANETKSGTLHGKWRAAMYLMQTLCTVAGESLVFMLRLVWVLQKFHARKFQQRLVWNDVEFVFIVGDKSTS